MTNGDDSAVMTVNNYHGGNDVVVASGLTKREYFAAMAMQGYLSNSSLLKSAAEDGLSPEAFAIRSSLGALLHADTLIDKLNE